MAQYAYIYEDKEKFSTENKLQNELIRYQFSC